VITVRLLLSLLLFSTAFAGEPLWPEELRALEVEPPAPLPSLSAQTCNACHGAIHDQWSESGHARASTSPAWIASAAALGNPARCQECHLPLLNQRAEIPRGPGAGAMAPNPAWEPSIALEGVTCAACHVRGDAIVGPRALDDDAVPHKVVANDALRGAEACAYCHQLSLPGGEEHPFLDTVGEWERSSFGQAKIPCQDCHMPRVSGPIAGSRYAAFASHRGLGDREPSAIARAVTVQARVQKARFERGDTVRATAVIMNTGAGHAVPTGDPNHRVEVRFELRGADGELAKDSAPQIHWLLREVETEPPFKQVRDERLQPGASRTFDASFALPKKQEPGRYTLVVSATWWAMAPEQAAAVGVSVEDASVRFVDQRIPIEVN
jgi:hypothetical protein